MKGWRLTMADASLTYTDLPVPKVRDGSVLIRMQASPLLSYLRSFAAGELTSYLPPEGEFTPGTNGIGIIEQAGPGVYGLDAGQRVFLSPHLVAAENVPEPAEALLGLTAEPGSAALLRSWPDGTLSELALMPAAAVTSIPAALDSMPSSTLAALSRCTVPYGGLLRGRLAAGETLIINGATGAFGSAGVLVALAMGASRVVAAGRSQRVLARLAELPRVVTVPLQGNAKSDADALREAAAGGADCALDLVGRADTADGTLASLAALRRGGRLVLMGSMTVPLPLDYAGLLRYGREILGNFMYPRTAPAALLAMAAAGQLDLGHIPVTTHPLSALKTAMDEAAAPGAPLVVLTPDSR
ncbi:MAG: zinc-binding dehydrogenase [Actinomycetota bacterium]